ncbi:unnamed protein product, partial [Rotaria magnacalcarata]
MTVGARAHEATLILFLCYARHHDFQYSDGRRRVQQSIEKILSDEDEPAGSNEFSATSKDLNRYTEVLSEA